MNCNELEKTEIEFLKSLALSNIPLHNFGVLYNAWVNLFIANECSQFSGKFTVGKEQDRLKNLTKYREIELKITELRAQLKKESFNRQVELNTQIKKLESELNHLALNL